jgi:hypothetical protein
MEAKPATAGIPSEAGARKQTCYAMLFRPPLANSPFAKDGKRWRIHIFNIQ